MYNTFTHVDGLVASKVWEQRRKSRLGLKASVTLGRAAQIAQKGNRVEDCANVSPRAACY